MAEWVVPGSSGSCCRFRRGQTGSTPGLVRNASPSRRGARGARCRAQTHFAQWHSEGSSFLWTGLARSGAGIYHHLAEPVGSQALMSVFALLSRDMTSFRH